MEFCSDSRMRDKKDDRINEKSCATNNRNTA